MSALDDLQSAQGRIKNPDSFGTDLLEPFDWTARTDALKSAIQAAITPPGPPGSPAALTEEARACRTAAAHYEKAANDIHEVATGKLPSLWEGAAAKLASAAIARAGTEVSNLQKPLEQAAALLSQWATALTSAQARDRSGVSQLTYALSLINNEGSLAKFTDQNSAAQTLALQGVGARIAAAEEAQAKTLASALEKLVTETRKDQVSLGNDAMSSAELAALTAQNGKLLTPAQIARANARLAAMSPADQAAFDKLLAATKSPLEAGYLWQALAAGTSMAALTSFAAAIGPHGADRDWLKQHLTPNLSTDEYHGASFSQGDHDDCVPASTIIAQAKMDPVLMLSLTTGGTAHGNDIGAAFKGRLEHMYLSQYDTGQILDGDGGADPNAVYGIGARGETALANQDLGAVTGSHYHYQGVDSSSVRSGVLGQINQAVSSGKPVPIDVSDGSGDGHQMMIIGQSNGKLQIYNPWGYTGWVSDSQFVNGQLGSLSNSSVSSSAPAGGYPTPYGVELPK